MKNEIPLYMNNPVGKFLNYILFDDFSFNEKNISQINFDEMIKKSSEYLLLPAIYSNIKKKKIEKLFPYQLIEYLNYIFELNYSRNENLISEIRFLSKKLNDNSIDHVFIKGASSIPSNLYSNIGERMVGDIDFLFEDSKTSLLKKLLTELNYKDIIDHGFFEKRHLTRKTSENKVFAVEAHTKLFDINTKLIDTNKLLKNKTIINGVNVPSFDDQYKINILNHQLNNYGSFLLSFDYRTYYDCHLQIKKFKINTKEIQNEIINKFYLVSKIQNVKIKHKFEIKNDKLISNRLKIRKKNILLSKIDKFIFFDSHIFLGIVNMLPKKIYKLIISREYRYYLLKKIKNQV